VCLGDRVTSRHWVPPASVVVCLRLLLARWVSIVNAPLMASCPRVRKAKGGLAASLSGEPPVV
jgi:hypothetical protein